MKVKTTKLVYIASPYTHKNPATQKTRYEKVTKLIGILDDIFDYAFIGPITQSRHTGVWRKNKDGTFAAWATKDFTYISRCDEIWVYMLDGWKESTGVTAEIKFAKANKIKIRYIDYLHMGNTCYGLAMRTSPKSSSTYKYRK